jgi:hypothetical protein
MRTDKNRFTGFLRPPWMAGVRKTQEQLFRRPPGMAGVRKTQEQLFRRPPGMAEVRSAKPSVNEASFTGQVQEQFFRFNLRLSVCIGG